MGVLNCNGVCLSNLQSLVLVSCFKLALLLTCYNKGCAIKAACCMFSAQKRLHSSFEHCLQTLQKVSRYCKLHAVSMAPPLHALLLAAVKPSKFKPANFTETSPSRYCFTSFTVSSIDETRISSMQLCTSCCSNNLSSIGFQKLH